MYPLKIKEKYNPTNLESQSNRFSVAYLWTYISWDYKEWTGSHPWVDIVPETKSQEVFSPLDGTVHKTWEDGAYGKYIIIEHKNVPHPDDMKKTTTLYSCFQHLSEVSVKDGQVLKEGDSIGRTGNTGNSFWEHLHFQIDRVEAPFHAYWPFTWSEAREAGTTFSWAVNIGLWIEKARMYTLNPLVYLDKVDEYRKNQNTSIGAIWVVEKKPEIISPVEEKIVLETKGETPIAKTSHIPLETVLTSNQADIVVSPDHIESTIVDNQKTQIEKIETGLPQEEKIEVIHSQEDIIVRNPIIDDIASQIDSESQKKNLKI